MKRYKSTFKLLERMEVAEKSTKVETFIKFQLSQMPNMSVIAGNESEENPPRLPTLRQATLERAIQIMQDIRAIVRLEVKHACCMAPGTLQKSVNYWSINPPSTLRHGHTTKENPAPEAKKRGKTVKFDSTKYEVNIMTARCAPIRRTNNGKNRQRSLRVTRTLQFLKRRNVIVVLPA